MRSLRELRRELNNMAALGRRARRLYLYFRGDVMVAAEDVLAHTQESRARLGCPIQTVGFEKAAHCALVREDCMRYWGAIAEGWSEDGLLQPVRGDERPSLSKL